MRRYLYSNLLKTIFSSLITVAFVPSALLFACSWLIDKSLNIASLAWVLSCLLLWILLELVISILNKKAKNSILFEEGKISYRGRTRYSNSISIKYFKFYVSVIEPSLVIPKVHINGNDLSVTCYISKKDVRKLKAMNFEIKEM